MTFKLGNEGHGDYIEPGTIIFHTDELLAYKNALRAGHRVMEIPTKGGSMPWSWLMSENAKGTPSWRSSRLD